MTEKQYDRIFHDTVTFIMENKEPWQEVEVAVPNQSNYSNFIPDRAAGRFWFKQGPVTISAYYVICDALRGMREPYFEIYPDKNGEARCFLADPLGTRSMFIALQEAVTERGIRMVLGTD